jgi:hypothetical protein
VFFNNTVIQEPGNEEGLNQEAEKPGGRVKNCSKH